MKKILTISLMLLLGFGEAFGQDITTRLLTLTAPQPPTVKQVSTTIVGNPGNATYYYWVVAKYASGNANPSPAAIVITAPNVLGVSNYVRVNWDAVAGATGYDVLRTTTANVPNGNCNCAVVANTASTAVNDQGGALLAYTVNSQGAVSSSCSLDNLTSATPVVTCAPYGWTPGGAAGGALTGNYPNPLIANLTTAGAVPYVASAGVLTQDATAFFWDSTNDRLGISTNTPRFSLSFGSTTSVSTATPLTLDMGGTFSSSNGLNPKLRLYWDGSTASGFGVSAGQLDYVTGISVGHVFYQGTEAKMRLFATTSNVGIGNAPTDGGYKLDIKSSGSNGTLRVYDQTATTGSTSLVVQAGAGQSTNNLQEWRNNAGTLLSGINASGNLQITPVGTSTNGIRIGSGSFKSGSNIVFGWTASTENDPLTIGFARASDGVVEINNGTAGTLRDLTARAVLISGLNALTKNGNLLELGASFSDGVSIPTRTPASASAAGIQGTITWDSSYIYIATGTNTWKRVAIATW